MTARAWGIYGGSFDPPHLAHLRLALHLRNDLGLAGVVFVPAGAPPNKSGRALASGADRLAMLRLLIEDDWDLYVSPAELDRAGPSLMLDTLALAKDGAVAPIPKDADLILLMGADTIWDLPEWHQPLEILALARVAVMARRAGVLPDAAWLADKFGAAAERISIHDDNSLDLSSSAIRAALAGGDDAVGLPAAVRRYIYGHGLYGARKR